MNIWMIVLLVAASVAGYGLIYWALRRGAQTKAAYQTFAESRGWRFEQDPGTRRSASVSSFSDPNDDWTLRIIFSGGGSTDGSTHQRVEWHTPQGALTEGTAVLGMPLPEKAVTMMQMGGPIGQQVLKGALKATLYALGKTRFDLSFDEATAGDPGGVVMASDGQAEAMDGLRRNAALAAYRAAHRQAEVPVIIRDGTGLILRRPGRVKSMDQISEMVALGLDLRKDL